MAINFQRRSIFVNGLVIASVCVLVVLFSDYLVPVGGNFVLDIVLDSVGVLSLLFGICLRSSARGHKHECLSVVSGIVTDGPYKLTQNPMYLASFLIGFGVVMVVLRWWLLLVYTFLYLLWYWPQIYNERKVLLRKYGQCYVDYSSRTPLFFPRLRSLLCFCRAEYLPLRSSWLRGELAITLVWVLVILSVEVYEGISSGSVSRSLFELLLLALVAFFGGLTLRFAVR